MYRPRFNHLLHANVCIINRKKKVQVQHTVHMAHLQVASIVFCPLHEVKGKQNLHCWKGTKLFLCEQTQQNITYVDVFK